MPLRRRDVLLAAGGSAMPGITTPGAVRKPGRGAIPGELMGADWRLGHRLRDGGLPEPAEEARAGVVVVGGGIAGLSAAWRLARTGVDDVLVLEMERQVGGNASSGRNATSAYPWGAHYIPMLTEEAVHAAEMFTELGIITGRDAAGRPVYDEYALCADPRERLLRYGEWQEDLLPDLGVGEADRAQYRAFFGTMESFRRARGADGRKAFAIPLDGSSADERFRRLDRITMAQFMRDNGWTSEPLRWYVRYCCRDDYGTEPEDVSAWAGVHYFASRDGRGGGDDPTQTVLAWPEGNGHIVNRLRALLRPATCGALAWRVRPDGAGVTVDAYHPATDTTRRIRARAAVLAVPHFVADRLLGRAGSPAHSYAPWVVANVTVGAMPGGSGAALCWDNVSYDSPSLGYVVATHQSLQRVPRRTVLTWYMPLSDAPPGEARRAALARPLADWQGIVLRDLLAMHPELADAVERVDVWLWGHGMIRPVPGYLWGEARAAACRQAPPVFFAHSDMSGISIFEEANHRGVTAADAVRAFLG